MQREPFKIISFQQQQRAAAEHDAERQVWLAQIMAKRSRVAERVRDAHRTQGINTICILSYVGHGVDYRHLGSASKAGADTKQQAESILIKADAMANLSFHRTLLREGVSQQERCGSSVIRMAASRNHHICIRRIPHIGNRKHCGNKRPQLCLADRCDKNKNQKLLRSEL